MKRIIKFRGQRVDNMEWVYGFYFKKWRTNQAVIHLSEQEGVNVDKQFSVVPESVGQMFNIRGIECFDGDKIMLNHWRSADLFNYDKPFVIEFNGSEIIFKQGEYSLFLDSLQGKLDFEVIGNIFETTNNK